VTTELFARQQDAVRDAYAAGLGVEAGLFAGGALTIVPRPEPNWGYEATAATFATGTVVAAAPELVEFARGLPVEEHRAATAGDFLQQVRDEARRLGRNVNAYGPSIGWGLARIPEAPVLPGGFAMEHVDSEWLGEELKRGRFPNGAGPADGSSGRAFRNMYGVLLRGPDGEPAALAGVFDTYGMHEIGVDVAPEWQGQGLGAGVVALAVRAILERGATPFYGCGPTNIRSQRTALSTGFLPVCTDGTVS
jgi:GNAT superfamily N-acetyltransferase